VCHAYNQWTEALSLVLLGIRTAYKEDLKSCVAELVYGEPLRVPGEFLMSTTKKVEASPFNQQLRHRINQL
jgi:hypothetical protein